MCSSDLFGHPGGGFRGVDVEDRRAHLRPTLFRGVEEVPGNIGEKVFVAGIREPAQHLFRGATSAGPDLQEPGGAARRVDVVNLFGDDPGHQGIAPPGRRGALIGGSGGFRLSPGEQQRQRVGLALEQSGQLLQGRQIGRASCRERV